MCSIFLCSLVLSCSAATAAFASDDRHSLESSDGTVVVGSNGVLTETSSALHTLDGPRVRLHGGVAEWQAFSYRDNAGAHTFVAAGEVADRQHRESVEPLFVHRTDDELRCTVRAGVLEIETWWRFDATQPCVLVTTFLHNRGSETLSDVFVTREWLVPEGRGFTSPVDLNFAPVPDDTARLVWMMDDLEAGSRTAVPASYRFADGGSGIQMVDVPLELWTGGSWSNGLTTSSSFGISWGDYDHDGFVDFFNAKSLELYHNDAGVDFTLFTDLQDVLDKTALRYGSSIADYDNDGLADIGTEPRQNSTDSLFHLLHNLGGGANFVDVAGDTNIIDVQPFGDAETLCWADVDFDGDLDAFLPVYPSWASGGPGNFFLHNLGPTAPGGEYRFAEESASAGLDNPPGSARPEGAEFCDVDGDGDLEMYSNGTLYQNLSTLDLPRFEALGEDESGVLFSTDYDEGAALFDYDMDGDFDLGIAYCAGDEGVRIFANDGDGTFTLTPRRTVESSRTGLCLGFSKADWDMDGDVDFTTRDVFRKNMLIETGKAEYVVATHNIPDSHITSATPAWADWDFDGDLDCMLGNYGTASHFYENIHYDTTTPDDERRHLRVRVLRDADVFDGLETEFGAAVEIVPVGETRKLRWRSFSSSSGGYLNQNEATLHFALPPDPFPDDDARDLVVDVIVDFPADPSTGLHRVDRRVNPVLGNLALAELTDRQITVYRSGAVVVDGCRFAPVAENEPTLLETDGMRSARKGQPLSDPAPTPGSDWYVGLDFDTLSATAPLFLKEVVLDAILAGNGVDCGGEDTKVRVWDVSDPNNPFVVENGSLAPFRFADNHRTRYALSVMLEPGRYFRLVARVTDLRTSPITAPFLTGPLTVNGGLSFQDLSPCTGSNVVAAVPDPTATSLALRFAADTGHLWTDLAHAHPGSNGDPRLTGSGEFEPGGSATLTLDNALAGSLALLVFSDRAACLPVAGGTLFPFPDFLVVRTVDGGGRASLSGTLPADLPPGSTWYFQALVLDPVATEGIAFSNAVSGTSAFR